MMVMTLLAFPLIGLVRVQANLRPIATAAAD
jgi:hypothetical protein